MGSAAQPRAESGREDHAELLTHARGDQRLHVRETRLLGKVTSRTHTGEGSVQGDRGHELCLVGRGARMDGYAAHRALLHPAEAVPGLERVHGGHARGRVGTVPSRSAVIVKALTVRAAQARMTSDPRTTPATARPLPLTHLAELPQGDDAEDDRQDGSDGDEGEQAAHQGRCGEAIGAGASNHLTSSAVPRVGRALSEWRSVMAPSVARTDVLGRTRRRVWPGHIERWPLLPCGATTPRVLTRDVPVAWRAVC